MRFVENCDLEIEERSTMKSPLENIRQDYPYLRMAAPFIILIVLFFVIYYARVNINADIRKEQQEKEAAAARKKKDVSTPDDDDDFDYSKILDPSTDENKPIHGKTEQYEWTQTTEEVEAYIPLAKFSVDGKPLTPNEFKVTLTRTNFTLKIRNEIYMNKDFTQHVSVDDSYWTYDTNKKSDPHLWLNLVKVHTTERNQHWKSLFKGDPEVNVQKLGPPVKGIDPSNPESIRAALDSLKNN